MGKLDAQHSGAERMKPCPKTVIRDQAVEIEILRVLFHFPGVVEQRGLETTVDDEPPLALQQQAVAAAESPAGIAAQAVPAAERRQQVNSTCDRPSPVVSARPQEQRNGSRGGSECAAACNRSRREAELVVLSVKSWAVTP